MARANVCAVFVTMMRDAQARQQLQVGGCKDWHREGGRDADGVA